MIPQRNEVAVARKQEDHLATLAVAERKARSRAAPMPTNGKPTPAKPSVELDPSHRARSIDDIAAKIDRVDEAAREADRAVSRVRRSVTKTERQTGAGEEIGGTGFTILKRRDRPITRLLENGQIGPEELQASEDITTAFHAQAGALFLKPLSMERRDPTHGACEPTKTIDAVARYHKWAKIWAIRTTHGDPTLEIVIAAVIDERGFREIEQDLRLRNGAASRAVAAGLRDYAARAGWAHGQASRKWLVTEGAVFRLRKSAA
jgi:hypothetical protein